jgi:hypothetical protein
MVNQQMMKSVYCHCGADGQRAVEIKNPFGVYYDPKRHGACRWGAIRRPFKGQYYRGSFVRFWQRRLLFFGVPAAARPKAEAAKQAEQDRKADEASEAQYRYQTCLKRADEIHDAT